MAEIKHLFHIKAPRQKVYDAIANKTGLSNWWTTQVAGDDRPGGVLQFKFGDHGVLEMKVTEMKPGELVKWDCINGAADWVGTNFIFALDENEGMTRVRFTQAGWREANDLFANCNFSWGRYMESLRQLCEKGRGKAFGSDNY
jgi:uncharacterized protein YndB with AHSA1/START domain